MKDNSIRLNKVIADSGLASRRAADRLIEEGSVMVNGKKVYELGVKVNPQKDRITVSGKPLKAKFENIYLMFNKPKGVLTTMDDPLERPTVKYFLGKVPTRVFPVGRLDWDSEGLLLLTNDGDWANKIMNPHSEVTKTYLVKVNGEPTAEHLAKLTRGVSIEGGKVAARYIEKINKGKSKKYEWIKIIITEGKNRQIRQMFEKIGFDVLKLQRVSIGRLRLGSLERGEFVYLNDAAKDRVFLADNPQEIQEKKGYKGKAIQQREKRALKGPRFEKLNMNAEDSGTKKSFFEKPKSQTAGFKKRPSSNFKYRSKKNF